MWSRKRIEDVGQMQGVARRIYDVISKSGKGHTMAELINIAYANIVDGGPLSARQSIGHEIRRLRKVGQKQGFAITVTGHGHRPIYRFVRMDK
jgi:hypothetical protein